MSVAKDSFRISGLFEAELLVELMLRYWKHPLADDSEFRNELLEAAVETLKAAVGGEQLLEDVPAQDMNFVAAIWYAEWNSVQSDSTLEIAGKGRQDWLGTVRRTLPSCFCDPDRLES